jgi:YihY family inner membrane protein
VEKYMPLSGEMHGHIVGTLAGVINARGQAGVIAFLILVWVAHRCFTTLICATTRAWGTADYNWWRLPLKSLMLLGTTTGAILVGMLLPVLMRMAKEWLFPMNGFSSMVYALGSYFIPLLVVFFSLSLFYRLAPRTPRRFSEVWAAALVAAALLQAAESLFVVYLRNFATLNEVYGTFGGIMALLLWIYFSGCIFIFGACVCAAQVEERSLQT